jgi:hypothetical protein
MSGTETVNVVPLSVAATPFTVTPERFVAVSTVPVTVCGVVRNRAPSFGDVIVTTGADESSVTLTEAVPGWSRASFAVAVMVFGPSVSGTLAVKCPDASTLAETPFTVTVERWGSVAVPLTVTGEAPKTVPAVGEVITTVGGWVSTLTVTVAGVLVFPALSAAVTVIVLLPSTSVTPERVNALPVRVAGPPFTVTVSRFASVAVPLTVTVVAPRSWLLVGLAIETTGGVVSRTRCRR